MKEHLHKVLISPQFFPSHFLRKDFRLSTCVKKIINPDFTFYLCSASLFGINFQIHTRIYRTYSVISSSCSEVDNKTKNKRNFWVY